MTSYLNNINDFINSLDTQSVQALNDISENRTFKKGSLLLRQDQICRQSYIITSGIARKYYLNEYWRKIYNLLNHSARHSDSNAHE